MLTKEAKKALGRLTVAELAGEWQKWQDRLKKLYREDEEALWQIICLIWKVEQAQRRNLHKSGIWSEINSREEIISAWTARDEDGTGWQHVMIVRAHSFEDAEAIAGGFIYTKGYDTGCGWDCSGKPFHWAAHIREMFPGRWIITQSGGLDV